MKKLNNLKRYITYFDNSSYFYFYWLLLAIILLGIFGIVPAVQNIYMKTKTLGEGMSLLASLNSKEKQLQTIKGEYPSIVPYITYLDAYMPDELNVEDYLVSINTVAARTGFSIKKLNPVDDKGENYLDIQILAEGYGDILSLIKGLEDLKRVTRIDRLEIDRIKGVERINIYLRIFSK